MRDLKDIMGLFRETLKQVECPEYGVYRIPDDLRLEFCFNEREWEYFKLAFKSWCQSNMVNQRIPTRDEIKRRSVMRTYAVEKRYTWYK